MKSGGGLGRGSLLDMQLRCCIYSLRKKQCLIKKFLRRVVPVCPEMFVSAIAVSCPSRLLLVVVPGLNGLKQAISPRKSRAAALPILHLLKILNFLT
jgi:hypothetical protein